MINRSEHEAGLSLVVNADDRDSLVFGMRARREDAAGTGGFTSVCGP
ncbi:hypothetical protein J31TS4_09720 [Paenibacillus sp. J31TS4]|nr:hypothetical protein J31TS4_09720 [Paenibacillus sp. J31TS4]